MMECFAIFKDKSKSLEPRSAPELSNPLVQLHQIIWIQGGYPNPLVRLHPLGEKEQNLRVFSLSEQAAEDWGRSPFLLYSEGMKVVLVVFIKDGVGLGLLCWPWSVEVVVGTLSSLKDGTRRKPKSRNIEQLKGYLFHKHKLIMCSLCLEGRKYLLQLMSGEFQN
ncbi:unnamed protein product [Fraxinus pennsylvanica]|uniref:Uncharacterized protein n=1 Tax=Fraxinus pennsylvanica TaxID=56036 RepID=A0AAD1ZT19_9LAMI|nr:unnamed protein product [Fraxinus pennsylvanica]